MSRRIQTLLQHLAHNTDFNTAPASTCRHGAYEGALRDHSWNVVNQLVLLGMRNNLSWEKPESPIIVGLAHDMCKTGSYYRNEDGTFYRGHSADTRHGAKSVEMVKQVIEITDEEEACIRWHKVLTNTFSFKGTIRTATYSEPLVNLLPQSPDNIVL